LVEKALVSDHPAARYNGPFHAKLFLLMKWLLPDWVLALATRLKA
jgi:hypothetical protein